MTIGHADEVCFRRNSTVELVDCMGDDQRIADAARVSTGNSGKPVKQGFIDFLMENRHGSPFEHASLTFRIEAPLFVVRQFFRHRMASYNEQSGRYSVLGPVFYVPSGDRPMVQVGKPGEYQYVPGNAKQQALVIHNVRMSSMYAYDTYRDMLEAGIADELARIVLPLNIFTSFYVTMNARSLMNFLSLRTHSDDSLFESFPQYEIEMVARQMEVLFAERLPLVYDAFNRFGRVAP